MAPRGESAKARSGPGGGGGYRSVAGDGLLHRKGVECGVVSLKMCHCNVIIGFKK